MGALPHNDEAAKLPGWARARSAVSASRSVARASPRLAPRPTKAVAPGAGSLGGVAVVILVVLERGAGGLLAAAAAATAAHGVGLAFDLVHQRSRGGHVSLGAIVGDGHQQPVGEVAQELLRGSQRRRFRADAAE